MTTPLARSPEGRRAPRRLASALVLAACLLAPAGAPAEPAAAAPFSVATDAAPGTRVYQLVSLIYAEAFRRLGLPVQVVTSKLARRSALASEGAIDCEASRIRAYGDANPQLIRVEEPLLDLTFALFTANPELSLRSLDDLAATSLLVEYRRGILLCESTLKRLVPPERLTSVATTEQGLKKLLAGRTDLYCDLDALYVQEALRAPEFAGAKGVRKVLTLASVPTYPYLDRRHAALAPRLAEVLRQMRAEGLIDAYLRQVGEPPEQPR